MDEATLQALDLKYNWHPCSQMKDYEQFKPVVIHKAYGSYIELKDGKKIIDAISSWWCKSLGHNHPTLKKALLQQVDKFEHVIFAHTTHDIIVRLSQKLAQLLPSLNKAFYAGDGSCAVEIAMKMSLHFRKLQGKGQKTKFVAFKNGYHGETAGALSVSDVGLYRDPYHPMLFEPFLIEPLYVSGREDPRWNNSQVFWSSIEKQLEPHKEMITAIIFEPIVQGAGGMKVYSKNFLSHLAAWAKKNDIHLIADEIMTGLGRTGKMLACDHAGITPDFVCLSKGLTSGWMPFSAVLTSSEIYHTFYDDYEKGKSFLHSHTYSGNALGASLALATLEVMEKEDLCKQVTKLQPTIHQYMQTIAEETGLLQNIRGIGGLIAADLFPPKNFPRFGYALYQEAIKQGILLRPLGNTLYWLPPLNVSAETLKEIKDRTLQALKGVMQRKN